MCVREREREKEREHQPASNTSAKSNSSPGTVGNCLRFLPDSTNTPVSSASSNSLSIARRWVAILVHYCSFIPVLDQFS